MISADEVKRRREKHFVFTKVFLKVTFDNLSNVKETVASATKSGGSESSLIDAYERLSSVCDMVEEFEKNLDANLSLTFSLSEAKKAEIEKKAEDQYLECFCDEEDRRQESVPFHNGKAEETRPADINESFVLSDQESLPDNVSAGSSDNYDQDFSPYTPISCDYAGNAADDSGEDSKEEVLVSSLATKLYSSDDSSDREYEDESDSTSTSQAEEVGSVEPDQLSTSQPNDAVVRFEDELTELEAEINAHADKFATYNIDPSDPVKPIAIVVNLVRICQVRLAHAVSSEKFDSGNLHSIEDNLLRVLKSVDMCRQQLLVVKGKEVNLLKSIPSYSDLSRGDLLTSLSKTSGVNFSEVLSKLGFPTSALGQAIEDISGGASTMEILKEVSICPMPVKHLLNMLAHTSTASIVLEQFTVEELGSSLHQSHKDAARLYKQLFGRKLDRKKVTALELLEVVVYYLKKGTAEDRETARYIAISMLDQVTMNAQAREKFEAVAPGYYDVSSTKRKETLTFLITLILADEIEAKAPPGLFVEHGGFLLRVLDLSWSDAAIVCRKFATNKFFTSPNPEATFTAAFKAVAKKKKRTALKSKLVIFNKEQMGSFQALTRLDG